MLINGYQLKNEEQKRPTASEVTEAISIGILAGIVGQYAGNIVSNILNKEPIEEIFIPDVGPAYYANVASGGIVAILVFYLDVTYIIIAASILNKVLIDLFTRLEDMPGYNGEELVYVIIRNTFALIIVLNIFEQLCGGLFEQSNPSFDSILLKAMIIGIIINTTTSFLNHYASLKDLRKICNLK